MFNVNGKLNGTTVASSLKWATSKEGFEALIGDYAVGFQIALDLGTDLETVEIDSPEFHQVIVKNITRMKNEQMAGIKFDSEGFVTNYPSRAPLKLLIVADGNGPIVQTETANGEPKKVETTLEKIGITKDVADSISENLQELKAIVTAAAQSAKSVDANVKKAYDAAGIDAKTAKSMQRWTKELFRFTQFQGAVARGVIAAVNEVGRAVKAGNVE